MWIGKIWKTTLPEVIIYSGNGKNGHKVNSSKSLSTSFDIEAYDEIIIYKNTARIVKIDKKLIINNKKL